MRLLDNFEAFSKNVETCMDAVMEAQTFKDPNAMAVKEPMGSQVMGSLATIVFEYVLSTRCVNLIKPISTGV
jgi:hypothetical protein